MPTSHHPPLVLIDLDDHRAAGVDLLPATAAVVIGMTASDAPEDHPAGAACDVVLVHDDPAIDLIRATVDSNPIASVALAQVLRGASLGRTIDDGLALESAVYSTLQAGPEFAAWLAGRPTRDRPPEIDPVLLDRRGATLDVTLNRPTVHNALNTAMRDQLMEALALPIADPSITEVHLRGAGRSFCAGGDLDEFGSFVDPASAHLVRMQQSIGRSIALVADRVIAHLHGACVGSGIELPAFAGRVVADRSTVISLPELGLGLIPGAGGTVSLPRRIGRWRTARLALTGERVDATTALAWGLVDAVVDADD